MLTIRGGDCLEIMKVDKIEEAVLFVGDDPLGLNDLSDDELRTLRLGAAHAIEKLEFWIDYHERRLKYGVTI